MEVPSPLMAHPQMSQSVISAIFTCLPSYRGTGRRPASQQKARQRHVVAVLEMHLSHSPQTCLTIPLRTTLNATEALPFI